MNIYHVDEQQYGWIFAFLSIAVIAPTQLNGFFLKRFSSEQIIYATLTYQSIISLILVSGVWADWFGLYGLIGMLFLFLCGQGITGPNASALSLAPFARHAGSAAALMGSFRMGFGALVSGAVSVLHNHTAMPMVGVMTGCIVSALFILMLRQRMIGYTDEQEPIAEATL